MDDRDRQHLGQGGRATLFGEELDQLEHVGDLLDVH